MKKSIVLIALACVMVFAFASTAMADHSPQFYFNWQAGNGVTSSPTFQAVFPTAAGLHVLDRQRLVGPRNRVTAQGVLADDRQVRRVPLCAPRSDPGTSSTAAPTTSSRYALNRLHRDCHGRHAAAAEVHRCRFVRVLPHLGGYHADVRWRRHDGVDHQRRC